RRGEKPAPHELAIKPDVRADHSPVRPDALGFKARAWQRRRGAFEHAEVDDLIPGRLSCREAAGPEQARGKGEDRPATAHEGDETFDMTHESAPQCAAAARLHRRSAQPTADVAM